MGIADILFSEFYDELTKLGFSHRTKVVNEINRYPIADSYMKAAIDELPELQLVISRDLDNTDWSNRFVTICSHGSKKLYLFYTKNPLYQKEDVMEFINNKLDEIKLDYSLVR